VVVGFTGAWVGAIESKPNINNNYCNKLLNKSSIEFFGAAAALGAGLVSLGAGLLATLTGAFGCSLGLVCFAGAFLENNQTNSFVRSLLSWPIILVIVFIILF
jgi:hypothetical protein